MVKNEASRYWVIWFEAKGDLEELRYEYEETVDYFAQDLIEHYAQMLLEKPGGRLARRFLGHADWISVATALLADCIESWLEPSVFWDLQEAYGIG